VNDGGDAYKLCAITCQPGFAEMQSIRQKMYIDLPVDQPLLLSYISTRPFNVVMHNNDLWADQKGQWIGTLQWQPLRISFTKKM